MASISTDSKGNRTIQFVGPDRKRRSIRLGKMPLKLVREIKLKVEVLNYVAITGHSVDAETARWVSDRDQVLTDKLAAVGLIESREFHNCELVEFVRGYVESRTDAKPNTQKVWRQTIALLKEFFGERRSIQSITKADAKEWRLFLVQRGMAEASVRKHCGFAKHFIKHAIDRELLTKNPFADLISASIGNAERQYFVSREEIQKVLDACPNAEWRLIVALSRYGGLRCPSEHFLLRWGDILWDQDRFIVHSPKTEGHQGRESRVVPLFAELRPYLEKVFDEAEDGQEFVIHRERTSSENLRTHLTRIIKRAGLVQWPRITHNLRASRQTELEAQHPTHIVCSWIGNTPAVAHRHYLQVREVDFAKACSALQNPVQLASAEARNEPHRVRSEKAETPDFAENPAKSGVLNKQITGVDWNRTNQAPFQTLHRV